MTKNTTISARIDEDTVKKADKELKKLKITKSQAIQDLLGYIIAQKKLPWTKEYR